MGRWSQGRRRGCGGVNTGFPLVPPTDADWQLLDGGAHELDAKVILGSSPPAFCGFEPWSDDGSGPGAPAGSEVVDISGTIVDLGTFSAGRWWARARWYDSDGVTVLSDWSPFQFIDLA